MFSSSVRRVALTAPPTPIVPSLTSSAPRAATSQAFSYRSHQRRLSSSKPPSPVDGKKKVDEEVAVAAHPAKKSKTGRKKAMKEKDEGADTARTDAVKQNLPSVPSTQHLSPNHINATSFFSLYRPISLTNSFPKVVTEDAFASIFTNRTRANAKISDVISTLTSTVQQLDAVAGNMKKMKLGTQEEQWNEETDELRAAISQESFRKSEVQHLDGVAEDSILNFPQHVLSGGKYRPFHPPPPPVPMDSAESLAAGAEAAESLEPQHRTYTAVLTVQESTSPNGEVTYSAHSSPLIEEPTTPPRFLERMQIRKNQYSEKRSEENAMIAISVKRQRKLKMKKHKYKKLMRRTRNLRRKLDRN